MYGIGTELDDTAMAQRVPPAGRGGIARGDHEAHGALRLTAASRPVLRGERSWRCARAAARRQASRGGATESTTAAMPARTPAAVDRLNAWRAATAREQRSRRT